jgi:TetR/AcrR family transcriptional regulator, transcriptional repressor for nem operon
MKRLKSYFLDLVTIAGQQGALPGCLLGRLSLEIAAGSPKLRKRIRGSFARWQHAIAGVIEQAVALKELPEGTDSEALAGFVLNSWQGALLRSQAEQSDAFLETFMQYVFDGLLTNKSTVKARAKLVENR